MSDHDIRIFKLMTGEEILAEVINDNSYALGQITIQNAVLLMMQQTQNGIGVGMYPWGSHLEDPRITLDVGTHIMYNGVPKAELIKTWEQAFSPIALPKSTLITG